MVLLPDKGNASVMLNNVVYSKKVKKLLGDPAYRNIGNDPTGKIEHKVGKLLKASGLSSKVQKFLLSYAPCPPRRYGLSKIHNGSVPMHPIVSSMGLPLTNFLNTWHVC